MGFRNLTDLKQFEGEQTQLLIMNQPTNIWLMVDKKIDEIVNVLNLAQTNYTAA